MQKRLLTAIIKSKIKNKKSVNELIDEFVSSNANKASKHLEEFLSELLVYINQNFDTKDVKTLLEIATNKLQSLHVTFETKDLETLYEKIAISSSIRTSIVFNKTDMKAIKSMRDTFTWVGVDYNKKTTDKLKGIIQEAFEGKVNRADLSNRLKEEFKGVLSGSHYYFEGVADHVISQAQNISRVTQALKEDVEYFKVMATIDGRTSDICRSMNGKIIEAKHLGSQVDNILNASSIGEKKAAAAWSSKPMYGKLPSNFGLPPYHFRCRTEVVPVWLSEEEIDGKKVEFADKDKDDIISHIDKTGVQRKLKKRNYHIEEKHQEVSKKDMISALNSITEIAPHAWDKRRTVAKSANGFFMVFEADEIVTIYKPTDFKGKANLKRHFEDNAVLDKKEIIKWEKEDLLSKFTTILNGLLR